MTNEISRIGMSDYTGLNFQQRSIAENEGLALPLGQSERTQRTIATNKSNPVWKIGEIQDTLNQVNKDMQHLQKSLHFKVHETSGQLLVEVQDLDTGEIIKTIPPERLLDLFGKIRSAIGALIDEEG